MTSILHYHHTSHRRHRRHHRVIPNSRSQPNARTNRPTQRILKHKSTDSNRHRPLRLQHYNSHHQHEPSPNSIRHSNSNQDNEIRTMNNSHTSITTVYNKRVRISIRHASLRARVVTKINMAMLRAIRKTIPTPSMVRIHNRTLQRRPSAQNSNRNILNASLNPYRTRRNIQNRNNHVRRPRTITHRSEAHNDVHLRRLTTRTTNPDQSLTVRRNSHQNINNPRVGQINSINSSFLS